MCLNAFNTLSIWNSMYLVFGAFFHLLDMWRQNRNEQVQERDIPLISGIKNIWSFGKLVRSERKTYYISSYSYTWWTINVLGYDCWQQLWHNFRDKPNQHRVSKHFLRACHCELWEFNIFLQLDEKDWGRVSRPWVPGRHHSMVIKSKKKHDSKEFVLTGFL